MTKYLWLWTHTDLDGVGCAVVAAHLFPQHERNIRYCNYNGPNNIDSEVNAFLDDLANKKLPEGEHQILITDIAPSLEVCKRMDAILGLYEGAVSSISIFDHHKTSREISKEFHWFQHSANKECATRMLYEQAGLYDEKLHDFVYAVDAWDRWVEDSKHRKRGEGLNALFKALGFHGFLSHFSGAVDADSTTWLAELEEILLGRRDRIVGQTVERQQHQIKVDKRGLKYVAVIGTGEYTSEIGNALLKKREDIDYVAIVLPGINVISLRARKSGTDVGVIAESFMGGGGHAEAAGFSVENVFSAPILDRVESLLNE